MLVGDSHRLDELIVLTLTKKGSATAAWLHSYIQGHHRGCTVQAVYKELRKLQRDGVVVKHHDQFSLSLTWILSLIDLADSMYKTHVLGGFVQTIFPEPGERSKWRFTSLQKLDDFMMHVTLALFECAETKIMYQWVPHPWLRLLLGHKNKLFRDAARASGYRIYTVMGKDLLSLSNAETITEIDVYHPSFDEAAFRDERGRYYYLIEDYLLTIVLDKKTTEAFEDLYKSLDSYDDFDRSEFTKLMEMSVSATVKLEHKTRQVPRIRKRFEECLGDLSEIEST